MPGTQTAFESPRILLARLEDARRRTDALFEIVKPEFLYDRPIPERHRIIFYIGHLEAFDWNLLREPLGAPEPRRPDFDRLFAFGIDPVGGGLPTDQPADWPSLEEVRGYNAELREAIDAGLGRKMEPAARRDASLDPRLHVAIEHRLMHEETLSYMFHQLPLARKIGQAQILPPSVPALEPAMVTIPAGTATLGIPRSDTSAFGWDNEYEAHQVTVPAFSIDRYMVSNGEYLRFLGDGGYENRALWTEANWNWISEKKIRQPVFWKLAGGNWYFRGMFEEIPLPLDWPVYVSQAEASAYARWAGKALPTEAQWHRAAYATPDGPERPYPWGADAPAPGYGNFDFVRRDPAPVHAYPESQSAFGVSGLLGNGWEWTSDVFGPFSGFERFPFYPGYSANFFDGKHYVMKGGSARTAASMLRRSFRNWFQAHYQYVYVGFRCVSA
jgi:iron(II)-dependent oxidoreductase